ncbi:MAG TPA: hypothetical protein VIU61_25215 [Kofleriaceae bacterium]
MRNLLLTVFLASVPVTAAAAPPPSVEKMATDDCARARKLNKTCVLAITESEDVEGGVPRSGEVTITAIDWGQAGSLIRVRRDFIPEILRTAEDL